MCIEEMKYACRAKHPALTPSGVDQHSACYAAAGHIWLLALQLYDWEAGSVDPQPPVLGSRSARWGPTIDSLVASCCAGADVTSSNAPALAYAEQLACVLIANLGDGGVKASGEGPLIPTVAALADSLLKLLLNAFPALYHSHACYAALLAQLQEEEGDVPMGQVRPCLLRGTHNNCIHSPPCSRRHCTKNKHQLPLVNNFTSALLLFGCSRMPCVLMCMCLLLVVSQVQAAQAGVGWARTKDWVGTAAVRAPLTTEALLHSFITSSDSLPGATAPAWQRDERPATVRTGERVWPLP